MGGEIFVHPHRGLSLVDVKAVMLEHLLLLVLICHLVTGLYGVKIHNRLFLKVKESVFRIHFHMLIFQMQAWRQPSDTMSRPFRARQDIPLRKEPACIQRLTTNPHMS